MKKIVTYTLGLALMTLGLSSCSDSYLDLAPESSATKVQLFDSPEAAQYVVNGLGRLMSKQYLSSQGLNGEGTIMAYFGEFPGADLQKGNYTGWSNTINGNYHENDNNQNMYYSWYYYYRIIGNANQILVNIPENPETDQEKWQYIEAQALVYRAYSYLMLSQIYSRRWVDRNGESRGLPLRLDTSNDALAASSLAQVYAQIYADLDRALSLFSSSGLDRSSSTDDVWKAGVDVAHAIYSRAALTRQDWNTCITHSQAARKSHPLMSADEYNSGFNTPNKEWIWSAFNDDTQPLYYYGYFAYLGSNCASSNCRQYPPLISRELVEQIPTDDSRLAIYAIPTESELAAINISKVGSGRVTSGTFFNRIKKGFADRLYSTTYIFYYLGTKFQVLSGVSIGNLNIFRAAEMIYNEAEAQLAVGNESAARALLEEAVAPYQTGYTCNLTGTDLLNEVRTYRRFDLWGEGHNWFDFKRWNVPMSRKSWADGGNWMTNFSGTGSTGGNYAADAKNYWTFIYPLRETQYNDLVTAQESDNWKVGDK